MPVWNPPTVAELAYIAGFVDGEGCISVYKTADTQYLGSYSVFFNITNCQKEVLLWIHERLRAGVVRQDIPNGTGAKKRNEISFRLKECTRVLQLIQPYMRVKARQVELVLQFLAIKSVNPTHPTPEIRERMEEIRIQLKLLNKKGEK